MYLASPQNFQGCVGTGVGTARGMCRARDPGTHGVRFIRILQVIVRVSAFPWRDVGTPWRGLCSSDDRLLSNQLRRQLGCMCH